MATSPAEADVLHRDAVLVVDPERDDDGGCQRDDAVLGVPFPCPDFIEVVREVLDVLVLVRVQLTVEQGPVDDVVVAEGLDLHVDAFLLGEPLEDLPLGLSGIGGADGDGPLVLIA